jgi:hypothetical protein
MKVWTKTTLGALAVILAGIVFAVLGPWRLASGGCDNEVLADVPAPDTQHRAVLFQRDCGATTGLSRHVSVLRGSRRLPETAGNAFVADTDPVSADSGISPFVAVRWIDHAHLEVLSDTRARVRTMDSLVDGIRIRFLTRNRVPRRRAHN